MRSLIYRTHLVPVLAWASSGLFYAWPNAVDGGEVQKIDSSRVRVTPAEALMRANEFAGKQLPTNALTLLMRDGRAVYQAIEVQSTSSAILNNVFAGPGMAG